MTCRFNNPSVVIITYVNDPTTRVTFFYHAFKFEIVKIILNASSTLTNTY